MKNLFLTISFTAILIACGTEKKEDVSSAKLEAIQHEIEDLKIKLAATEAQLLNVQAELSQYKLNETDSSIVETNN